MNPQGTDVTIRAIFNRPLPDLAEITSAVETFISEIRRVFGSEPWVSVTGGTWGKDAQANARLLLRAPEDAFGPCFEHGLAPALVSSTLGAEAMLMITAAPIVGENSPLNQVSLRLITGSNNVLESTPLHTLMQMMVYAFGPVATVVLTSAHTAFTNPQDPWDTPVGHAVWLPLEPEQRSTSKAPICSASPQQTAPSSLQEQEPTPNRSAHSSTPSTSATASHSCPTDQTVDPHTARSNGKPL